MKTINQSSNPTLSVRKKLSSIIIALMFFFGGSSLFAQDQFLWVGTSPGNWTDRNNWAHVDASGIVTTPANYYPCQGGGINSNGTKDDIVMFTNEYNGDCYINAIHTGTTSGNRCGGIHVKGYKGSITQANGNRFLVADSHSGLWDNTTILTYPPFAGDKAYQAYFDFDPNSSGFIGGASIVGGIAPSYAMLIGVPLTIKTDSKFTAPEDELRIRHNATIESGEDFINSLQGTVVLSNRSGGLLTRNYYFGAIPEPIHFYNLKVSSAVQVHEFSGGISIVDNNFYTSGVLGRLGAGSGHFKMNAAVGTEIHIKQDIIVGNIFNGPSYTGALSYGDIVLVMNGEGNDQRIEHTYSNLDFAGNLPALRIDKTGGGDVILDGPIAVNNFIEFIDGVVHPNDPSTNQNDLLTPNDLFVINSNTTIISPCNDNSYCSGPIRCRTGKSIELPLGKNGKYRPAIIEALSGLSADYSSDNTYTTEYFGPTSIVVPTALPNLETNLNKVSDCEVWAIQKANTTDGYEMNLSLSFDSESCTNFLYDDQCELVVSRWDVSDDQWKSHGNGGLPSTFCSMDNSIKSSISILSSDFDRSPSLPELFTFGDIQTEECDACAISLYANYCVNACEFTFDPIYELSTGTAFESVLWNFGDGTSTELHPTHTFSSTGIHTVTVEICANSGTGSCCTTYTFDIISNDCPTAMTMLKNKNQNQTIEIERDYKEIRNASVAITPNPSYNGKVQVELKTEEEGEFKYRITNISGQQVMSGNIIPHQSIMLQTSELTSGSYILTIQLSNETITKRMMVAK